MPLDQVDFCATERRYTLYEASRVQRAASTEFVRIQNYEPLRIETTTPHSPTRVRLSANTTFIATATTSCGL